MDPLAIMPRSSSFGSTVPGPVKGAIQLAETASPKPMLEIPEDTVFVPEAVVANLAASSTELIESLSPPTQTPFGVQRAFDSVWEGNPQPSAASATLIPTPMPSTTRTILPAASLIPSVSDMSIDPGLQDSTFESYTQQLENICQQKASVMEQLQDIENKANSDPALISIWKKIAKARRDISGAQHRIFALRIRKAILKAQADRYTDTKDPQRDLVLSLVGSYGDEITVVGGVLKEKMDLLKKLEADLAANPTEQQKAKLTETLDSLTKQETKYRNAIANYTNFGEEPNTLPAPDEINIVNDMVNNSRYYLNQLSASPMFGQGPNCGYNYPFNPLATGNYGNVFDMGFGGGYNYPFNPLAAGNYGNVFDMGFAGGCNGFFYPGAFANFGNIYNFW